PCSPPGAGRAGGGDRSPRGRRPPRTLPGAGLSPRLLQRDVAESLRDERAHLRERPEVEIDRREPLAAPIEPAAPALEPRGEIVHHERRAPPALDEVVEDAAGGQAWHQGGQLGRSPGPEPRVKDHHLG